MLLERVFSIESRAADDDGVISLAVSSEAPYERWWGVEILSHERAAVDLSRLGDGRHPLLLNHDTEKQIGVVLGTELDESGRVLRARARFSRSALGQEILQDVKDGIRSLVSVGYLIDQIEEVSPEHINPEDVTWDSDDVKRYKVLRTLTGAEFEREMQTQYGEHWQRAGLAAARADGAAPVYRVTRWTPFEASIVPVPADPSVGIGRSAGAEVRPEQAPLPQNTPTPEIRIMSEINTPKPEELAAARVDAILKMGEQYAKYIDQRDVATALRNGHSVEQFKDLILAKMEARHTDTSALHLGLSAKERQSYSFGRALQAAVTGDWSKAGFELECSRAVAKLVGQDPTGFYVPFDTFKRDFNVGTATEAGNLVPTELRTDLYTDVLRNALVMGRLGARILTGLTGNVDIPRKTTAGTLGVLTEIGSASETNPVTAKLTLSPKRVGAYVQVSKQALMQAALSLENMIRDDLVQGAAVLMEAKMMSGTGTSEILGLRNVSGIGTVVGGANGLAPAWSHLVDLESACAVANAEPDMVSGYLVNAKTRGKYKQTQYATNLPMIWTPGDQALNGYRVAVSNNLPSNLTKGTSTTVCSTGLFGSDWSMATIGLFGAPDVTVDPYSLAATGQVQITLSQFADMVCRLPAAFAKIDDWVTG
jgi:HK97 family phage major capsid protein